MEEGVRTCEMGFWDMNHDKVEICQVKKPMCLLTIQCLSFAKIGQVFVVGEDLDGKWGAMKVVLPSFESRDNSKEFIVIYVIVMFHRGEGLRKIRTGMPFTIGICLKKNGT